MKLPPLSGLWQVSSMVAGLDSTLGRWKVMKAQEVGKALPRVAQRAPAEVPNSTTIQQRTNDDGNGGSVN